MARPKKNRQFCCKPGTKLFKPAGIPLDELKTINLNQDEFEAIKHRYFEVQTQEKIAELMQISQPTFHRILNSALQKIAEAIVQGNALSIGNA